MIYDPTLKKGVKKQFLPHPNPNKVELPKMANLQIVYKKAIELYFKDIDGTENFKLCLADSSGIPLHIEKEESWILCHFFQQNGLKQSRFKLYVMLAFESSPLENNLPLCLVSLLIDGINFT